MNVRILKIEETLSLADELINEFAETTLLIDETAVMREAMIKLALEATSDPIVGAKLRAFARVLEKNSAELSAGARLHLSHLERLL